MSLDNLIHVLIDDRFEERVNLRKFDKHITKVELNAQAAREREAR